MAEETQMGSRILCACGEVLRKNIFEGHHIDLLVSEDRLSGELDGVSADALVEELVLSSRKVLTCKRCDRLHVLNDMEGVPSRVYVLEDDTRTRY